MAINNFIIDYSSISRTSETVQSEWFVYVAFSPSVTKKGGRGAAESLVLKVEVMVPKIDVVILFLKVLLIHQRHL